MGDAEYKRNHLEQGLCVDCSSEAFPGKIRCLEHLYRRQLSSSKYYFKNRQLCCDNAAKKRIRRKNLGLCSTCGNKKDEDVDKGYIECQNCRERLLSERCK
jgi:hypothetical protein